jgi:AmmeMemoRadiSam system protein A
MPDGRGQVLLAIAREAIEHESEGLDAPVWAPPWLRAPAATFVTLTLDGELRGCIGTLEPRRALGDDVMHNARAASHDARFPPLPRERVRQLGVEVSLLTPREPLVASSEDDALCMLRPGVDGVVVEYGAMCATFLPQVWEHLPEPLAFLTELRRKAHLPGRFWHRDLRLSRYGVEKFR